MPIVKLGGDGSLGAGAGAGPADLQINITPVHKAVHVTCSVAYWCDGLALLLVASGTYAAAGERSGSKRGLFRPGPGSSQPAYQGCGRCTTAQLWHQEGFECGNRQLC